MQDDWNPMQCACVFGFEDVVEYLIGEGCNIGGSVDSDDVVTPMLSPFHLAVCAGRLNLLSLLSKTPHCDVNHADQVFRCYSVHGVAHGAFC